MEFITGLEGIARACCILLALIYALNINYPRQQNFAAFQKLFLDLDASKLSKSPVPQTTGLKRGSGRSTLLGRPTLFEVHNVPLLQSSRIARVKSAKFVDSIP